MKEKEKSGEIPTSVWYFHRGGKNVKAIHQEIISTLQSIINQSNMPIWSGPTAKAFGSHPLETRMSVLNLSASQPEVVWMFSLASVDDNYDELIQLLLIYTLNNPCLRVSPSAFSLFFFSSSVFLLHLVLAVTYRSVSQGGLHDNICLVMTLFGLFLVCDPPRAVSTSSSPSAPRLSLLVWWIPTNVSLRAIARGEV